MFRKELVSLALLFIVTTISPAVSIASPLESIDNLNSLVSDFIKDKVSLGEDERLEVKIGDTGTQLQLAQCDQPIDIKIPSGSSQQQISTLQMTCNGQQTWNVYVPINMKILTKVVVAKQTISGKEIISDDMLDFSEYDKNSLFSGYFKDKQEIIGQSPVTTMIAGTVITHKNIQKPILINRNQNVSIISRHGTILVKADGIAKSSGGFNDIIKVLNPSSKRMIDAAVISSSSVEVR